MSEIKVCDCCGAEIKDLFDGHVVVKATRYYLHEIRDDEDEEGYVSSAEQREMSGTYDFCPTCGKHFFHVISSMKELFYANLDEANLWALKDLAKQFGVPNYRKLTKAQLVDAVKEGRREWAR